MNNVEVLNAEATADKGGMICVTNEGFYIARFTVAYKLGGKDFLRESTHLAPSQRDCIDIPKGATDITVRAFARHVLSWSVIFTEKFDKPVTKCYKVYGTIFDLHHAEIECP